MDKKTRLKRLSQLKYMLENHKDLFKNVKFDMGCWLDKGAGKLGDCGTAACALGSACIYPPFQKQGLMPAKDYRWNGAAYEGAEGFAAGEKFFGITYSESHGLFDPDSYEAIKPKPSTVAKKVDKLIKRYSAA